MNTTSLEERKGIITLVQTGHTDREIAAHTGRSVSTVRKWRRRYAQHGVAGLGSHVGRPATGPLSQCAPEIVEQLRVWRAAHPGWGPLTLRAELERAGTWATDALPSRASIARWLAASGQARRYARHTDLPQPLTVTANVPHAAWELDARGHGMVPDVGVIALLNLNDRCSRTKLLSYPCWLGNQRASHHPATEDYQLVLRLAASEWGLPDYLLVDRDSVFYDNGSKSPFPTRLHLWLQALDVELVIGPAHQPQHRGIIERSHQTWAQQVLTGAHFRTWEHLYYVLRERRDFLNTCLPCAALDGQPPLVAYPQAQHPRHPYRPECEAELLDLERVYAYLAQGRWFRKGSNVGAFSLGHQWYSLGKTWRGQQAEITFDAAEQHLIFAAPEMPAPAYRPLRGITKTALMGELGPLVNLFHFQLALPFTCAAWRVSRLSETLL